MGYVKNNSGGGASGGLPDYSTSEILYPRKWIGGEDVKEIAINNQIPIFNSAQINLGALGLKSGVIIPVEYSFSFVDSSLAFKTFNDWQIRKIGVNGYLILNNSTSQTIQVVGVLRFVRIL